MSPSIARRLGLTPRVARIAAQAAVATAVVGGILAYVHAEKTVTLTVDGKSQQVSAFADTVGELLADQGLDVGQRDLVAPVQSQSLAEGDTVVVRYGRPVTVTVDGRERIYWTTETTVDGALSALGLRDDGARLSASRSAAIGRAGLTFSLYTPKEVSLTADGATRAVTTTASTVGDLLTEQEIVLGSRDVLSTVPLTAVTPGLAVKVTRVTSKYTTVNEAIAFGTTRTPNAALYKGQSKVVKAGTAGVRAATYRQTLVDGKVTVKRLHSAKVVKAPVARVVQVGTKARPVARSSGGAASRSSGGGGSVAGADGLNWAALARCESGGNPRIVSSNGMYHGLYQFSASTWRAVGGSGVASQASSAEQTYRAKILYKRAGAGQWPHCGPNLFR